jgi:hypothetical protein
MGNYEYMNILLTNYSLFLDSGNVFFFIFLPAVKFSISKMRKFYKVMLPAFL